MKKYQIILAAGLTITLSTAINTTFANAGEYTSEYSLTVLGLNVGKSKFHTKIEETNYTITGSLKAAGFARLFTSVSGTLTANGAVKSGKLVPQSFNMKYIKGKTSKSTTMSFSGGNISKFANQPKTKKRGDWVELQQNHLQKVLDPFAAMIVPASSLSDVCNKKLKIFEGAMRADFQMRYVRTIPFSTKGYKGDAVTCKASFNPISGYDKKKKDIRWMRDKGSLEISFAPVGKTGLYAPVKAKIGTRLGTATISAKRFEALTN